MITFRELYLMNSAIDTFLLSIALALVAGLFSLLTLVIGWIGNKLYGKLDEMSKNLVTMASELHNRITNVDKRLTRVETLNDIIAKED
jgi:uncharacterized protein YoxC